MKDRVQIFRMMISLIMKPLYQKCPKVNIEMGPNQAFGTKTWGPSELDTISGIG